MWHFGKYPDCKSKQTFKVFLMKKTGKYFKKVLEASKHYIRLLASRISKRSNLTNQASQFLNDKTKIIFHFDSQDADVTRRDLLNVTIWMEGAPASQTFLVTSVKSVLMDFLGFPTVKVSFNCQHFQNTYSYVLFFDTTFISF